MAKEIIRDMMNAIKVDTKTIFDLLGLALNSDAYGASRTLKTNSGLIYVYISLYLMLFVFII